MGGPTPFCIVCPEMAWEMSWDAPYTQGDGSTLWWASHLDQLRVPAEGSPLKGQWQPCGLANSGHQVGISSRTGVVV